MKAEEVKYIDDLSYDELVKVFENLDSGIIDDITDYIEDRVYEEMSDEFLIGAPSSVDCEYFGRGEHFTIEDADKAFIDWVDKVYNTYGGWMISEDIRSRCHTAHEMYEELEPYFDDEEAYKEYQDLLYEIGRDIMDNMRAEFESAWDEETQLDYFSQEPSEFVGDKWNVDTNTWRLFDDDEYFDLVEDDEDEDYKGLEQLELPTI